MKVLVVEDDPDVRELLDVMLTIEGFQTETAQDGRDGLRRLRESPQPDVVLLDLMMPVMNGWTFRDEQLRDPSLASIPVIVMSALGRGYVESLHPAGALQKPLDLDQVISMLHKVQTPGNGDRVSMPA